MKFLKRRTSTIFIMLGNSCNMNCRYCLQHPLVHEPLASDINPDIYDFIAECAKENEKAPVHLQFYGGEPLLYFEAIKEVVEHTRDLNCSYGIITNGRALTDDMVEFFNAYDVPVMISWDGPHVLETRGFDSLNPMNPLRRRILRLKRLGLTAVISAKAYPKEVLEAMQDVSDDYYRLHGYQIMVNLDTIFDTGIADKNLLSVDYDRVEKEMQDLSILYLESMLSQKEQRKDYTKLSFMGSLFYAMKSFYLDGNGAWNKVTCACGNGYTTLNMDLKGNLYPCHNTSIKAGSIYDSLFSYLNQIWASDPTKRHKEGCMDCLAVAFCKGGCKLVSDEAREKTYCRLKKAMFVPVLSTFQRYGEKLVGGSHGG
ncbi:radical SAM/SPASM domain-containing protein [uncultured Dialister sp.]|uniref:radical SAM/SPASM domain-containing protein n=1 Tax=Dialister succinatiphilus TaxID=487173 RepID=UPI00266FADB3|nr:radical SAM protein [uncultured Dialister sp.]